MTFVGELAFAIGLGIALLFANKVRRNPFLAGFIIFLYFWHSMFSIFYWYNAQNSSADSNDFLNYSRYFATFGTGTQFVVWILGVLRDLFDFPSAPASDLDYFLFFQIFGYVGLIVLLITLVEVAADRLPRLLPLICVMCCLPGINYWNASVGKDGLVFLGITLVVYASLRLNARIMWCAVGIALVALIRPHIALLLVLAYLFQLLWSRRIVLWVRLVGIALGALAVFIIWPTLLEKLDVTELNTGIASRLLSDLLYNNANYSSAVNMQNEPLPLRIFTYMFRPLFFDGNGRFGFIASLENLALIMLFVIILRPIWSEIGKLFLDQTAGFNFMLFSLGLILLASATSNIGIADRQKTMLLPSLYVVGVKLSRDAAARRKRSRAKWLGLSRSMRSSHGITAAGI